MRVAVIHAFSIKSHMIAHPLRVFRRHLTDHGLDMQFFHRVDDPHIADYEVVLMLESDLRTLLRQGRQNRQGEIELAEMYRGRGQAVVWFDDSDSSGMIRDYVLSHVDLYLKTQLLCERSWYTRESPFGISFRDFYQAKYQLEDDRKNTRKPVPPQYLDKLWLGWNIGLSDLPVLGRSRRVTRLMYRMPWHRFSSEVVSPSLHQRAIDVLYRVSRATGSIDTFRFQRIEMREQLELLRTGHPTYVYHMDGKVPKKLYDQEMSKAVIIPSPFGDGEMCYRDFEAIRAGGVMLKADMGHLDMRPNFYAPGVTYVPHAWDFSDFPEKVLHILEHRADYEGLARSAQETYLRALSPQGGEAFALHVREIAQEALARRQAH